MSMSNESTSIWVSREVQEELFRRREPGVTYDDVVRRLIESESDE